MLGVEPGRRLARGHREHLQQVRLQHVAQRAGGVVVARAALQPELLVVDDLDPLDVVRAPRGLEQPVVEPGREHRERGPLAEEVVDAVDAPLRHDLHELLVQLRRAVRVVAERLLEREHGVLGQVEVLEDARDLHDDRRRQREVDDEVAVDVGQQPLPVVGLGRIGLDVLRGPHDRVGDVALRADLLERALDRLPPLGALVRAAAADHLEAVEQLLVRRVGAHDQAADAGQQQPLREVAAGAEDEHRRGGHARERTE